MAILNQWHDDCWTPAMPEPNIEPFPLPYDPGVLEARYRVTPDVLEDLCARRRAGAHDGELRNLLRQPDRGGLTAEDAASLVAELPR